MGHITVTERVAAPVEAVFAYVDDYRNTTKYMEGLSKWAPVGSTTHGRGAVFAVAMKAGPMTLSSVVDITTWTENRAIGWISREGFKQTGTWSFARSGTGTHVTFDMEYELGGGIAGRMVSRTAEPIVRGNIEKSVRNLTSQVQTSARKAAAGAPGKAAKPASKPPRPAPKRTAKPAPRKR
jgi:carbon monoxide dehydrogenase subunit G